MKGRERQKSLKNHLTQLQAPVRMGLPPGSLSWVISEGTTRLRKVSSWQSILMLCAGVVLCAHAVLPCSSSAHIRRMSSVNTMLCLTLTVPRDVRDDSPLRRAMACVPVQTSVPASPSLGCLHGARQVLGLCLLGCTPKGIVSGLICVLIAGI